MENLTDIATDTKVGRNRIPYSDRVEIYTHALFAYGQQTQMVVAIEELSECQKEICKALRGKGDREHLAEEIADARICLEQMAYFFCMEDDVEQWMDSKIKRLDKKLNRGGEG
jgi:hypothetical protein